MGKKAEKTYTVLVGIFGTFALTFLYYGYVADYAEPRTIGDGLGLGIGILIARTVGIGSLVLGGIFLLLLLMSKTRNQK